MLSVSPIMSRVAPIARKSAPKMNSASKTLSNVRFNSMPSYILDKEGRVAIIKCGSSSGGDYDSSDDPTCIGDMMGSALPMGFAC